MGWLLVQRLFLEFGEELPHAVPDDAAFGVGEGFALLFPAGEDGAASEKAPTAGFIVDPGQGLFTVVADYAEEEGVEGVGRDAHPPPTGRTISRLSPF